MMEDMKATGIVRRIDDLGRVVIPKEIRRTMRIREGDPLEIFTDADGEVIFKKYSPVGELSATTRPYAEVLFRGTNLPILITDRDRVIACAGLSKKEAIDRRVTSALETVIENRTGFTAAAGGERLRPIEGLEREAAVACPIIGGGDVSGCVIMLMNENGAMPTTTEVKLIQVAASFLGRQMEE
jgi:AbrB family transcriptional regulator (stage V sporulation protein T)